MVEVRSDLCEAHQTRSQSDVACAFGKVLLPRDIADWSDYEFPEHTKFYYVNRSPRMSRRS